MTQLSRTENSIKNIVVGIGGQCISLLVGFISRTIFVRCLSAEYLGISGLFTNILSMLSLAELGIGSAIGYALYKPLANNDQKKISALMNYYAKAYKMIGIIVIIVGIMMMPFLELIIQTPINISENIYLLYSMYLFNSASSYFFSYKSSLLICDQNNYIVLLYSYTVNLIQNILQIIVLLLTKNYVLYLSIQLICGMAFNLIISHVVDKKYNYLKKYKNEVVDSETKKDLITNIRALVITKFSGLLVNNTDNIIITYFSGLKTVGIQSNYTLLVNTLNTILNQVFNGITASVGNLNAMENEQKKLFMFNVINLLNFWLYAWCSISFIILADDIVTIFFGDSYLLSMDITLIMALNFYTTGMQNAVWTYRGTLGLFKYGKYLLFLTALINLILSMFLGNIYGLFGILFATFISRLFTNLWYDPYAVFKYGLKTSPINYLKKYIAYLLIGLLTLVITFNISAIANGIFPLKLIICVVIPNLIFLICFVKTNEFNYLYLKLKQLIHR